MQKVKLLIAMALVSLSATALEVESTAGSLSSLVTDPDATSLTITGTMDARDFYYIANNMSQLKSLDISGVDILAYTSEDELFGSDNEYSAKSIPTMAFFGSSLSSVSFPDDLQAIGSYAFAGCEDLTAVTLPESLASIGSYAFNGTGLSTVEVPASASLGEGVFSSCEALESAVVNSEVLGEKMFANDTNLSQVTLGAGVTEIGSEAFSGCASLAGITLEGDGITTIGNEAFMSSGLESLEWNSLDQLTTVGDWAFANSQLQDASLPESVESIGEGAFFYDTNLSSFNRPAEVTTIPAYSLAGLPNLSLSKEDLDLTDVTEIGDYAFYNVTARSYRVEFPSTLSSIGERAFAGTTHVENYSSKATTVPALGENVWEGVDQPAVELAIDNPSVANEYRAADQWKEFRIVSYPTSVERLTGGEVRVFAGHGLITIEAPDNAVAQVVMVNGANRTFTVKAGRTDVSVAPGIYLVRVDRQNFKVLVR